MLQSLLRATTVLCLALVLGACRLIFVVPQGGEVHAQLDPIDGPGEYCDSAQECTLSITQPGWVGNFVAVPHAGWKFAGWNQDAGFICGPGRGTLPTETPESCFFDVSSFTGNPVLEAILADDEIVLYASPTFVPDTTGQPIVDTILAGGLEWAQPSHFTGLSWEGIHSICPAGSCGPGAVLRGYDMNGWTLASLDQVNALANHYLTTTYTMGPGPDSFSDAAAEMQEMMYFEYPVHPVIVFADGPFLPTPFYGYFVGGVAPLQGLTNTPSIGDSSKVYLGRFSYGLDRFLNEFGTVSTAASVDKSTNDTETGAFFYRTP